MFVSAANSRLPVVPVRHNRDGEPGPRAKLVLDKRLVGESRLPGDLNWSHR